MNNRDQLRRINSPRLSRTAIIRVVAETRVPHDVEMRKCGVAAIAAEL